MIKKIFGYLFKWTLILCVASACLLCGLFIYINLTSPNVLKITGCIETHLNKITLCEKSGSYTPLPLIAQTLQDAIVVSEDARFFEHHGIDITEIKNSFLSNLRQLKVHRGASTITQQLVKNVFLTPDKTILRKLREIYLTIHVENILSKKEILEKYLNVIEFGKGVFGVKQAAQHYFSKSPDQLNILESASLAYLLPSPIKYSQVFKKGHLTEFAHWRIAGILRSLKLHRKISSETLTMALARVDSFPFFGDMPRLELGFSDEDADALPEEFAEEEINKRSIEDLPIDPTKGRFIEFDFNDDGIKDMLVFEQKDESNNSRGFISYFALIRKNDKYSFIDTIKINPKYLDLNSELGESKSIRTFFPDLDDTGDLVEYIFNNDAFTIKAEVISKEDANEIFKTKNYEIFEL